MADVMALIHEENGVYGISFPDFPGCISTADSISKVLHKGAQALSLHLDGMAEDDEPMPRLRNPDEIKREENFGNAIFAIVTMDLPGKAVRINITIDENLLKSVDRAAKANGSTRSGFLAQAARTQLQQV